MILEHVVVAFPVDCYVVSGKYLLISKIFSPARMGDFQ